MQQMWKMKDLVTNEEYVFPINPNQMNPPFNAKNLNVFPGLDYRTVKAPPVPGEWNFGGVCRGEDMHDALVDWSSRGHLLEITDHLNRTFRVLPSRIEMADKRSRHEPWKFTYTISGLLVEQVGGGVG